MTDGRERRRLEKDVSVCVVGSSDLTGVVVLRVEQVTQLGQQLWPGLQLPFRSDRGDQDTCEKGMKRG